MKTLAAVILLLLSAAAYGQVLTLGEDMQVRTPMCVTQRDMEAVARADSTGGPQKAIELIKSLEGCGIGEAMVRTKSVTLSLPTERGAKVSVIEATVGMNDGSRMTIFMMVDVEVQGVTKT